MKTKPRKVISARVTDDVHRALRSIARKRKKEFRTLSSYVEHVLSEHARAEAA
jgi:hypothetical protein